MDASVTMAENNRAAIMMPLFATPDLDPVRTHAQSVPNRFQAASVGYKIRFTLPSCMNSGEMNDACRLASCVDVQGM